MNYYYPLMLDLHDRLAVVIGGGKVGRRKADGLVAAGARVRIVDPNASLLQTDDESRISWIAEAYQTGHLDGASLAFAAAKEAVNARVVADAKVRGIWVNSADDPEAGDFIVPAIARSGDLRIAISTGGAAPAAARRIRDLLGNQFDASWADWLEIQRELRPIVLDTIADPHLRQRVFEQLADLTWVQQFRGKGREATALAMRQVVKDARKG
jgi:precorrin-2 dehydrogenase/sirohydrochlorin ferrochelatase